jgi:hypothetical protein
LSNSALYDTDALAWSERQAALLERLASGERVNAEIDWPNLIEEVRDVGQSLLHACESLLQQAMRHLLKLHAWPASTAVDHWQAEAATFLDDAKRRFSPSMRQRIDLAEVYASALRSVRRLKDQSGAPRPLPDVCPFTLDALLAGDIDALVGMI